MSQYLHLQSKAAEVKDLQEEKQESPDNITLIGWLFKRGVKGPTAIAYGVHATSG